MAALRCLTLVRDVGNSSGPIAGSIRSYYGCVFKRESREPRPLCRLPNGRGRHLTANVPGDFAAHRGTAAAATTSASVRRSMVVRSRPTNRRSASPCQGKSPDNPTLLILHRVGIAGMIPARERKSAPPPIFVVVGRRRAFLFAPAFEIDSGAFKAGTRQRVVRIPLACGVHVLLVDVGHDRGSNLTLQDGTPGLLRCWLC